MPAPFVRGAAVAAAVTTVVAGLAACKPQQPAGAGVSELSTHAIPQVSYVLRAPEGPVPTLAVSYVQSAIRDPYDRDEGAIEQGRFLYVRMNCAYCHGFDGKGGMGPDLTDQQWRYGGSDADIFASIYRGRAQGMPAWGSILPENEIWQLVAYVRALGGASAARYRAVAPGRQETTRKSAVNTTLH